jgi:hypothetical protein
MFVRQKLEPGHVIDDPRADVEEHHLRIAAANSTA